VDDGEVVVAAGGDGTVAGVAHGLVGGGRPMTIAPFGTANNIAHSLGLWPTRDVIGQLLVTLADPVERGFDVGIALGSWGRRYFYESAGVGLFAEALEQLFTDEDKAPRRAASALAAFLEQQRAAQVEIHLDEVDVSGAYLMVEVMNVSMFGPNLRVNPTADPFDGRLDVALVTEKQIAHLHDYLRAMATGAPLRTPAFDVQRARHVQMSVGLRPLRIDGGLARGATATELSVAPGALRMWLPR
jgi:diacylglycerol kinase family enzyme